MPCAAVCPRYRPATAWPPPCRCAGRCCALDTPGPWSSAARSWRSPTPPTGSRRCFRAGCWPTHRARTRLGQSCNARQRRVLVTRGAGSSRVWIRARTPPRSASTDVRIAVSRDASLSRKAGAGKVSALGTVAIRLLRSGANKPPDRRHTVDRSSPLSAVRSYYSR